jgi:FkbM family methyltransferase
MMEFLGRHFPFLAPIWRYYNAIFACIAPIRASYSQTGEDALIARLVSAEDLRCGIYVDVGANHPTRISNTYLFYRKGARGIIVEPNRDYRWLYRIFRPRDAFIGIACGRRPALLQFHYAATAVMSGFREQSKSKARRSEYLPVLPLDAILPAINNSPIFLLSVDVEGMNFEVMEGASQLLERTKYVIVEYGDDQQKIESLMSQHRFTLREKTLHNLVYEREG